MRSLHAWMKTRWQCYCKVFHLQLMLQDITAILMQCTGVAAVGWTWTRPGSTNGKVQSRSWPRSGPRTSYWVPFNLSSSSSSTVFILTYIRLITISSQQKTRSFSCWPCCLHLTMPWSPLCSLVSLVFNPLTRDHPGLWVESDSKSGGCTTSNKPRSSRVGVKGAKGPFFGVAV